MTEDEVILALCGNDVVSLHQWARSLAREIVSGSRQTTYLRHPLEFVCMPIYRKGADGLCLHVWDADTLTALSATGVGAHAHSWDLFSYVAYGTILNDIICVREDKFEASNRVYEVRSTDCIDAASPTPRLVRHSVISANRFDAGTVYALKAGTYHRSGHLGNTITIVYGRNKESATNSFLGPLNSRARSAQRTPCSTAEIQKIHRLLNALL